MNGQENEQGKERGKGQGKGESGIKDLVIGVAGGYCSGKNVFVGFLKSIGFKEIDVDKIGHEALENSKEMVAEIFGREIIDSKGSVDRRKLGNIVFKNKKELAKLEKILHPPMFEKVKKIVDSTKGRLVINAALLFKIKLHTLCDYVICVKAPVVERLKRAVKRDGVSVLQAVRRIKSQKGICFNPSENEVDTYSVWNSGSLDEFKTKAWKLFKELDIV